MYCCDAPEGVRGETAGPAGRASWPRVSGSHAIIEIIAILRAAETRCVSRLPQMTEEGLIPTWRRAVGFETNKRGGCGSRSSSARRRTEEYRAGCRSVYHAQTTVLPRWPVCGRQSILTVPHPRRGGLFLRQAPLARKIRSNFTCEDLSIHQKYHGRVVATV